MAYNTMRVQPKNPLTLWRYTTNSTYQPGEIITAKGDHRARLLEGAQQQVEDLVRDTLTDGHPIRATSLYCWKILKCAGELAFRRKLPLIEVSVDLADVRFEGDLRHFSDAEAAINNGTDPTPHIELYCAGNEFRTPRIEVLVAKATFVRVVDLMVAGDISA